jgi:trehalose/maltose transport system substrate-binding protein
MFYSGSRVLKLLFFPVRHHCIAVLMSLGIFTGCGRSTAPPSGDHRSVTVLMWSSGGPTDIDHILVHDFTKQTGIAVHLVPAAESSSQRVTQELTLLQHRSSAVDVFEIDTTWPGLFASYLVDLSTSLADRIQDELPELIQNATFGNRIVAAPFLVGYGLLYYRKDLVRKYGFAHPPRTWSELERQSRRIQQGERRAGNSEFWGYVWQGADYEGLTCNALEWQYSQGGGNFITSARQAHVDNEQAIQAFARAARWVGTISPPGVTAYVEEDSRNIWQSGNAAFLRNWGYVYPLAKKSARIGSLFAVAPLPSAENRHSSVLGGWYLGVTAATHHKAEALAFVSFMTSKAVQIRRAIHGGFLPTLRSVYRDPAVLRSNEIFSSVAEVANGAVRRPASIAGPAYGCVSRAYAHGVHQILTGEVTARVGVLRTQDELQRILQLPPNALGACQ